MQGLQVSALLRGVIPLHHLHLRCLRNLACSIVRSKLTSVVPGELL